MNRQRFFVGSIWDNKPAEWPLDPELLRETENKLRNELAELYAASQETIGSEDTDGSEYSAESSDEDYEIEEEELSD